MAKVTDPDHAEFQRLTGARDVEGLGVGCIPPETVASFDHTTPEGQWMAWANNEMAQLKRRIKELEAAICTSPADRAEDKTPPEKP